MDKPNDVFLQHDLQEYTKFVFKYTMIYMKNKITLLHKMKNNTNYYTGGETILGHIWHQMGKTQMLLN